jgi:hypothetical protein
MFARYGWRQSNLREPSSVDVNLGPSQLWIPTAVRMLPHRCCAGSGSTTPPRWGGGRSRRLPPCRRPCCCHDGGEQRSGRVRSLLLHAVCCVLCLRVSCMCWPCVVQYSYSNSCLLRHASAGCMRPCSRAACRQREARRQSPESAPAGQCSLYCPFSHFYRGSVQFSTVRLYRSFWIQEAWDPAMDSSHRPRSAPRSSAAEISSRPGSSACVPLL